MSGHRRYRRQGSSESWSSGSGSASLRSIRASTTDTDDDVHGGRNRRLKRSSDSLPVRRSPASHHSWVLLNQAGARRRDGFSGDGTKSAVSRTSRDEEISVSLELVEPPGTSVLAFDWQPRPLTTTPRKSAGDVIAAHRDVLLLAMMSYEDTYPPKIVIDLFVYQYQASRDRDDPSQRRRPPSLLLLPSAFEGRPVLHSHDLANGEIGIMSCTSNDVDDTPSSFVVAQLRISCYDGTSVRLFRSGSGQWESFHNLHVRGGGSDLDWWSTDAVVPYRRRYMIWVDYYRGMVLMDMSSQWKTTRNPPPPPRLRYVPLPVDRVGDAMNHEFGSRGSPKACRSVCVTRYGVKFVSIDTQHWSNFAVGHRDLLKWSRRFRITTWSLREDDYTWRKDVTMHEEEFWDAFNGGDRFPFPHIRPEFPVVDLDNPDVIIFRLEEDRYPNDPKWMIEVDLRRKVLLAATAYSKKEGDGLSCDAETINSARMKPDFVPIPSELPQYLDGGQASQASKKRRR